MSEMLNIPAGPERATKAATQAAKVRLHEFVLLPQKYSHRNDVEFRRPNLQALMDSIVSEGLQVPPEFYRDDQGRPVALKGHRRITSLRLLADANFPEFTHDMEVDACEVINATPEDRLLRSILDNVNRAGLNATERMRAGKVLFDAGVDATRAAYALGISPKQHERGLRIAIASWMLQHVEDDSISATNASRLLEEAEKADRVADLKDHLDLWIADKKREIRDKRRVRKVETGKDLKPSETAVKNLMARHLVDHWIDQLKNQQPFDEAAPWNYTAVIEAGTGKLQIESLNLDLKNAPLHDVAKVVGKLNKVVKDIVPFLQSRKVMEAPQGPQARLRDQKDPYDLDIFVNSGLADLAQQLQEELHREPAIQEEATEDTEEEAFQE